MKPVSGRRAGWVASLALLAAAFAALSPTPALGAGTISLAALAPTAQVHGEVSLFGSVGDSSAEPTVESYVSGEWKSMGSVDPAGDGSFVATFPTDTPGYASFRASIPGSGGATAVTSDVVRVWVLAESSKPFTSAPVPTVSGDQTVGTTVKATLGSWAPKADAFTYRWFRNGVSTGSSGPTYALSNADLGAYVTVSVGGWRSNALTLRDSRPTTKVVRGTFRTSPPEIVGRAVLGETLQAVVANWSPTPSAWTYQWRRDGDAISGATASKYILTTADVGASLTVTVRGTSDGVDPAEATSKPFPVPVSAERAQETFGDLMAPESTTPWPSSDLTYAASGKAPAWGTLTRTPWDAPGAFTHSQKAEPFGTLVSAMYDKKWTRPDTAEYPSTNTTLKNADVSFKVTARRFAVVYRGTDQSDAMVWVNGRPIAGQPIRGVGSGDSSLLNWISITLPTRQAVTVRFAGPTSFTGVDIPASENAKVTAKAPALTLGVLSDSYYELCSDTLCQSRGAAPALAGLTGFRVWNMSESGTGYVAPGYGGFPGYETSPFGSTKRLDGVLAAPLDALLIGGSVNDGNRPPDAFRPAVEALLNRLDEERPDLPVVLLGLEPVPGAYRTGYWQTRANALTDTLKSMVGRHQNVVGFIDPFTNPWLTGTGSIAKPTGDGNGDKYIGSDGVHLSAAGTRYYQQRVTDELAKLPLPAKN